MKERTVKELIADVKEMVSANVLVPEFEVDLESYICFVVRHPNGRTMYHAGKLSIYAPELQESFLGAFINENVGNYKIVGIYKMAEYLR